MLAIEVLWIVPVAYLAIAFACGWLAGRGHESSKVRTRIYTTRDEGNAILKSVECSGMVEVIEGAKDGE